MNGVYQILHVASGKRYVGSSLDIAKRWSDHRKRLRRGTHYSRYLQRAWNKYGELAFKFEVLEETSDLLVREEHWMSVHRVHDARFGYNTMLIANGAARHSEESRAKIKAKRALQKNVVGGGIKSVPRTAETRAKLSAALTGRKLSPERVARIIEVRTGTKASEETRRRMSEAHKRLQTPERRARVSAQHKGRVHTAEAKANFSAAQTARFAAMTSEQRKKAAAHLDKGPSQACIEAGRKANTGRVKSPEERAKRSASITAWWAARKAA